MTKKTKKPAGDQRQPEFRGMPAKTRATLRAEELAAAMEELDIKKEAVEHKKLELIGQMKAEETDRVVCVAGSGIRYAFDLKILERLSGKKQ